MSKSLLHQTGVEPGLSEYQLRVDSKVSNHCATMANVEGCRTCSFITRQACQLTVAGRFLSCSLESNGNSSGSEGPGQPSAKEASSCQPLTWSVLRFTFAALPPSPSLDTSLSPNASTRLMLQPHRTSGPINRNYHFCRRSSIYSCYCSDRHMFSTGLLSAKSTASLDLSAPWLTTTETSSLGPVHHWST